MTQAERERASRWKRHYSEEVERSIKKCNAYNWHQTWTTRPMTQEEYDSVFGDKPNSCHKLKISK